jgi:5-methyltetrahydrofolate--homocysteine methyltransferase
MKKAVAYLEPFMDAEKKEGESSSQGTIVIATVKGDVHDIGKNIVSVVLACNGYKVVDLGVMVKAETILKAAIDNNADFLGLSGLITPSLDEMIHIAKEMQRTGFTMPLLIGGATTSAAHTAIKIAQHYDQPIVQVGDASLVVEVCTKLKSPTLRAQYVGELKETQTRTRERFEANRGKEKLLSLKEARSKGFAIDWKKFESPKAPFIGSKVLEDIPLDEVVKYFDWSPFFWSWELKGKYPSIFDHPERGAQAKVLFDDAQVLLKDIIANKRFKLKAVYGYYPAQTDDHDDVVLYENEKPIARFYGLRQQKEKVGEQTYYAMSDFIAPIGSGKKDVLGAFAVTAGSSVEEHSNTFKNKLDDYSAIIVKALGDRFAEATAEWLHEKVRKEMGSNENLTPQQMIDEEYKGIRPALGYPACPDHSEKLTLWKLMGVESKINISLTESFAMNPPSSVSGLYFFNPEARYFNVGIIDAEQLEEYATRKKINLERAKTLLSPNLG